VNQRVKVTIAGLGVCAILVALAATGASAGVSTTKADSQSYTIYAINDESTPGAGPLIREDRVGVQAAVAYINRELHGLNGHTLRVLFCDPHVDPAQTTTCAQQAISAKPLFATGLSLLMGPQGLPLLEKAQIPWVPLPVQPPEFTDPDSFPLGGGSGTEFSAAGRYMANVMKAKKVSIIIGDTSVATSGAVVQKQLEAKGASVTMAIYKAGTADFTPTVATATQSKPDAIYVACGFTDCLRIYPLIQQSGFPMSKVLNQGGAVDDDSFFSKADPKSVEGTIYTYEFSGYDDTSNADVALYRQKIQKYAKVPGKGEFYQWGFSNMMTMYNVLKTLKDTTSASLQAALSNATKPIPIFMGASLLPRSKAPSCYPSIRQPLLRVVQYKDGKLINLSKGFVGFGSPC